ncbi:MAG: hypothetical protein L0287_26705 [Anaerolineae bacterium]|nr:hypothetical protein [Anaerolineae bacterium]
MRNEQHYRHMLEKNPNASVGFTLAASMIYAARYGFCEPADHSTDEWKSIARLLKSEYGEHLSVDEVSDEMNTARRQSRYGTLIRGWDWRTVPELLEQADDARQKLNLSQTEFLERAITELIKKLEHN